MRQFLDVVYQTVKIHCASNFFCPLSVKRLSCLLCRRLPNTGSTVAKRLPYWMLPSGLSMLRFILSGHAARGRFH